jgi:hypothetical protein
LPQSSERTFHSLLIEIERVTRLPLTIRGFGVRDLLGLPEGPDVFRRWLVGEVLDTVGIDP